MSNPVASITGPDKKRALVYYITTEARLALDQYPYSSEAPVESWSANGAPTKGVYLTPNNLVAVYQYGMVKLYGMIQPSSDTASYVVSELSPTVRFINILADDKDSLTTPKNQLAALCDGGDLTWFYYLVSDTDTSPLKIRIGARDMKKNAMDFSEIPDATPHKDSRLSAVYLPETDTKLVFFQATDNTLWVATITANGFSNTKVDNTGNAGAGATMDATYTGSDQDRTIYLYYLNNIQQLSKAVGKWDGKNWKWNANPTVMDKPAKVNPATQVTVVNDGTQNRVFSIPVNAKRYAPVVDSLTTV